MFNLKDFYFQTRSKGGQKGHKGETLKPFPNPDEIIGSIRI